MYIYLYIYIWSATKTPAILNKGADIGLWKFMEMAKNSRQAMGPFQISDIPFQGNVILNYIDFWRRLWTRFGPTRVRAPQKVFFLISQVRKEGNPQKRKPSPCI